MTNKNKDKGMAFERRVIALAHRQGLTATRQPGSGIFKGYPNDALIENVLIECKCGYCSLNSAGDKIFRLDIGWIDKVLSAASKNGNEGAALVFRPGSGPKVYALIEMEFFLALLKEKKDHALLSQATDT